MTAGNEAGVGDSLPPLRLAPINRTLLALFAGASGDHNPMHIDLDFARRNGASDVIAHGMLGMAWLGRLVTGWAPQCRLRGLSARFREVIRVGDALTCEGHVVERFESDGEGRLRIALRATDQHGRIKLEGEAVVAAPSPARR